MPQGFAPGSSAAGRNSWAESTRHTAGAWMSRVQTAANVRTHRRRAISEWKRACKGGACISQRRRRRPYPLHCALFHSDGHVVEGDAPPEHARVPREHRRHEAGEACKVRRRALRGPPGAKAHAPALKHRVAEWIELVVDSRQGYAYIAKVRWYVG